MISEASITKTEKGAENKLHHAFCLNKHGNVFSLC